MYETPEVKKLNHYKFKEYVDSSRPDKVMNVLPSYGI